MKVADIKPYFRNPRRIPDEAVKAVKDSIEQYGYVQPIVVDHENVVVVGHTRLKALKELGVTSIPVYVTDLPEEKVKEYRLADNRTGEMTDWDHGALVLELREFEQGLLDRYFPDFDLEIEMVATATDVTQGQVDDATKRVLDIREPPPLATVEVVCPSCFHTFKVRADSLPGLSKGEVQEMKAGGKA
jgi:hypothetical protein